MIPANQQALLWCRSHSSDVWWHLLPNPEFLLKLCQAFAVDKVGAVAMVPEVRAWVSTKLASE